MIKTRLSIEVKIQDRAYELFLSQDSPLGEVFDALCQMQSFVIDKIKNTQPPAKEADAPVATISEEQPQG